MRSVILCIVMLMTACAVLCGAVIVSEYKMTTDYSEYGVDW